MTKVPNNFNNSQAYKSQSAILRMVGRVDTGRRKCPNCESRCSGREMYESGEYWCYVCGWRSGVHALPVDGMRERVVKMSRPVKEDVRPVGVYRSVASY